MTVFRHKCNTRGCWLEQRWDSNLFGRAAEAVDGAWPFPRGISPSDIDGFVECRGSVLFIETKGAGVSIPTGQDIALKSLRRLGATVLIQFCDEPATDSVVEGILLVPGYGPPRRFRLNRLERDRLAQAWFAWADAGGHGQHPWSIEVAA